MRCPLPERRLRRHIESSLREARAALDALLVNEVALQSVEKAAQLLVEVFRRKGRVFACGNGGSMCDAMHFAEELTGRYRRDRAALAATAISDPGHLSCVGNDLGYEQVFSRHIEAHGPGAEAARSMESSVARMRSREPIPRLLAIRGDGEDNDLAFVGSIHDREGEPLDL